MDFVLSAEEWFASVALKKATVKVVQLTVAWIISKGAIVFLGHYGAQVDATTLQNILTAALTGTFEVIRNFVKMRFGLAWL